MSIKIKVEGGDGKDQEYAQPLDYERKYHKISNAYFLNELEISIVVCQIYVICERMAVVAYLNRSNNWVPWYCVVVKCSEVGCCLVNPFTLVKLIGVAKVLGIITVCVEAMVKEVLSKSA